MQSFGPIKQYTHSVPCSTTNSLFYQCSALRSLYHHCTSTVYFLSHMHKHTRPLKTATYERKTHLLAWFNIIIWILSILVLSRICISTKDSNISDIGSQIVLLVRSFPLIHSVFHDEKAQNNFVTLSIYNIFFHPAFCIVATASWVLYAEPWKICISMHKHAGQS